MVIQSVIIKTKNIDGNVLTIDNPDDLAVLNNIQNNWETYKNKNLFFNFANGLRIDGSTFMGGAQFAYGNKMRSVYRNYSECYIFVTVDFNYIGRVLSHTVGFWHGNGA